MRETIRTASGEQPPSHRAGTASRRAVRIVLALLVLAGCGSRASRSDLAAPDRTLGEAGGGIPATPTGGRVTPASVPPRSAPGPTTPVAPTPDGPGPGGPTGSDAPDPTGSGGVAEDASPAADVADRSAVAPTTGPVAVGPDAVATPVPVPAPVDAPATATPAVEAASPSSDPGAAFAAAVERADRLTYHAVYEGQATAADGSTTHARIEVWNRPGATRRDVAVTQSGHRLTTQQYRTTTGRLVCFDGIGPTAAPTCAPVPGASATDGAAIAGAVDASDGLTMMRGSVDGVTATCFRSAQGTATRPEACFDDAGIPVVLADSSVRVVRTALAAAVTDPDVTPPAT